MKRFISILILFSFTFTGVIPAGFTQGVPGSAVFHLSAPGVMVQTIAAFHPPMMKGMTIHPDNPFQFDFIVDTGDEKLAGEALKTESNKLIKYFLASLAVPEDQMWVNLSPYEKNRIIPESFGQTEMGRDLLMQDYMLKQLTASLMYPDEELGEEFWKRVYAKAQAQYGTTEIPMNTFNKIWIVPERANKNSTKHGLGSLKIDDLKVVSGDTSSVVREVLIPEIEREVNEGKTFANLRQIYNASILATWFKQNLKESVLGQIYVDQGKTKGVDVKDAKAQQEHIYEQYVAAFKKGAFDLIKEEYDPATQTIIPHKYFSGGMITDARNVLKERISTGSGLDQLTPRERRQLMNPIDGPDTLVRVSSRLGSAIDPFARWAGMSASIPQSPEKMEESLLKFSERDRTIIEKFNKLQGMTKVVDMGSGTGHFSQKYREKFPGDAIIGYEINQELAGTMFDADWQVLGDASHTGLLSKSIDKVTINLPDPKSMEAVIPNLIKEARRILKPGGEIYIVFQTIEQDVSYQLSKFIKKGENIILNRWKDMKNSKMLELIFLKLNYFLPMNRATQN